MKYLKKHIRIILGIILLILGIGFMAIPFIPIGYIFIFVAAFFLATYIPALNRLLTYLKKKDKKGRLDKVEHTVEDIEEKLNGDKDDQQKKSTNENTSSKDSPLDINIEKVNKKKRSRDHSERN